MIRPLTADDLPLCGRLGLAFYEEAELAGRFVPETFCETWDLFISNGLGTILGWFDGDTLRGVIGGVLAPDPNNGELVAQEMFWFVAPESRGLGSIKLLGSFEDWALESGAVRVSMFCLEKINSDVLDRVYRRRGYSPLERQYMKELH